MSCANARLPIRPGTIQGLHHRRGAHAHRAAFNALLKTLEEPPPHVISSCDDGAGQGARPSSPAASALTSGGRRSPTSRACCGTSWSARTTCPTPSAAGRASTSRTRHCSRSRGTRRAASATPSAPSRSSSPTPRAPSLPPTCSSRWASPAPTCFSRSPTSSPTAETGQALQFVQRLANEGTDYSQFIRDLLRHLRQLFLLQHLEASAKDDATLRAQPGPDRRARRAAVGPPHPAGPPVPPARDRALHRDAGRGAGRDPRRLGPAPAAGARPRQDHAAPGRSRHGRARGAPAATRGGRRRPPFARRRAPRPRRGRRRRARSGRGRGDSRRRHAAGGRRSAGGGGPGACLVRRRPIAARRRAAGEPGGHRAGRRQRRRGPRRAHARARQARLGPRAAEASGQQPVAVRAAA